MKKVRYGLTINQLRDYGSCLIGALECLPKKEQARLRKLGKAPSDYDECKDECCWTLDYCWNELLKDLEDTFIVPITRETIAYAMDSNAEVIRNFLQELIKAKHPTLPKCLGLPYFDEDLDFEFVIEVLRWCLPDIKL